LRNIWLSSLLLSAGILSPLFAHAYIGPGLAGGVIIAILGFFLSIFLVFWAIVYYPMKRRWQQYRKAEDSALMEDRGADSAREDLDA
jgi:hypothetical protein